MSVALHVYRTHPDKNTPTTIVLSAIADGHTFLQFHDLTSILLAQNDAGPSDVDNWFATAKVAFNQKVGNWRQRVQDAISQPVMLFENPPLPVVITELNPDGFKISFTWNNTPLSGGGTFLSKSRSLLDFLDENGLSKYGADIIKNLATTLIAQKVEPHIENFAWLRTYVAKLPINPDDCIEKFAAQLNPATRSDEPCGGTLVFDDNHHLVGFEPTETTPAS